MSRRILAGATDISVVIRIIDSTDGTPETGVVWNTSGIDLEYRRELAASTDITEATLAALTTAHTDGGFLHIGNGYYRLDLPDAACATGATGVLVHGTVTGMVVIGEYIELVSYNPYDGVRLGLTALPNAAADAAGGLPISDAGALDLDALNTAAVRLTAARAQIIDDWVNGGRLDLILDIIAADTTTDIPAILGTPAGVSLAADIAAIEAQTDDIGVAGAGLTAIPWNATWDAEVESEVDDALGAGTGTALTAIPWNAAWDAEVQSEADDALVARNLHLFVLASGTADSGSTTTMVDAARTEADADYWKGRLIVFTSGNLAGQCAIIEDFNAVTDTFTFAPVLTQAVSTHTYIILPGVSTWDETLAEHLAAGSTGNALNAAGSAGDPWATALPGAYGAGTGGNIVGNNLNATVSSRATQTTADAIEADTQNIQTRIPAALVAGRIDSSVGAMAANSLTASALAADAVTEIQSGLSTAAALSTAQTDISAILADTGTDGVVVAAASKTGYALSAAGIQAIWDALTSALTTASSIGKLLVDNINATISSRSSHAAADVWSAATRLLTAGTNIVLAKGTGVTGFNDLSAAQVNAEVVDALATDTYAEPGQGAPAATTTLAAKINYIYKSWRNRKTQTTTTRSLYADDGTTVDQVATDSDDGTTFVKGEMVSGP